MQRNSLIADHNITLPTDINEEALISEVKTHLSMMRIASKGNVSSLEIDNSIRIDIDPKENQITISDKDKNPLPENEESEEQETSSTCCTYTRPLRRILYAGPFAVGVTEAADILMSLIQSGYSSRALLIITTLIAFASEVQLTGKATMDNLDETLDLLKKRKLPYNWKDSARRTELLPEWPNLPKSKEYAASILSVIPSVWGILLEGSRASFFMGSVPQEVNSITGLTNFHDYISPNLWKVMSYFVAGGSSITTGLTESMESYKNIRKMLAQEKSEYTSFFSKMATPIIAIPLSLLKSLQDSAEGYVAIKSVFGIGDTPGSVVVGAFCTINIFPNFSFSGKYNINELDSFFGYMQGFVKERKYADKKKMAAFFLALGFSTTLAYFIRGLNEEFYHLAANDLTMDRHEFTDPAFYYMSCGLMAENMMRGTATLYPPMHSLVDKTTNKISNACYTIKSACFKMGNFLSSCLYKQNETKQPLLRSMQGNQRFYSSLSKQNETSNTPQKERVLDDNHADTDSMDDIELTAPPARRWASIDNEPYQKKNPNLLFIGINSSEKANDDAYLPRRAYTII